jgi:hypothetical protein
MLLVGDSHAETTFHTLNAIQAVRDLYNIKSLVMVCTGLLDDVNALATPWEREANMDRRTMCRDQLSKAQIQLGSPDEFRERVFKEVEKLQQNDVVVFAQLAGGRSYNIVRKLTHAAVQKRNASFIFYGDNPHLRNDMTECVPTWIRPNDARSCETSVTEQQRYQASHAAFGQSLASAFPSTYYFERWPLYCNGKTCDSFIPGSCTIAYIDFNHLSIEGSTYSSPFMCSFMAERGLL